MPVAHVKKRREDTRLLRESALAFGGCIQKKSAPNRLPPTPEMIQAKMCVCLFRSLDIGTVSIKILFNKIA
jgi:hypothetical protein